MPAPTRIDLPPAFDDGDLDHALAQVEEGLRKAPTAGLAEQAFVLHVLAAEIDAALRDLERMIELDAALEPRALELRECARLYTARIARPGAAVLAGLHRATPGWEAIAAAYADAMERMARRDFAGVAAAIAAVVPRVPPTAGTLVLADDRREFFAALCDVDGLTGPFVPYASSGSVGYAPYGGLRSVEFRKRARTADAFFWPAHLVWRDGTEQDARVPVLYEGSGLHADKAIRAGAVTRIDDGQGFLVAFGQRMFCAQSAGAEPVGYTIAKVRRIEFDAPGALERATEPPRAKPFWKRWSA